MFALLSICCCGWRLVLSAPSGAPSDARRIFNEGTSDRVGFVLVVVVARTLVFLQGSLVLLTHLALDFGPRRPIRQDLTGGGQEEVLGDFVKYVGGDGGIIIFRGLEVQVEGCAPPHQVENVELCGAEFKQGREGGGEGGVERLEEEIAPGAENFLRRAKRGALQLD